jgi:predicted O-linked N-acetylglucosamine transferase (SPINDLY family)
MGLPDLIAGSEAEYVALVLRVCTDDSLRRSLQDRIAASLPRVFADQGAIDDWAVFLNRATQQ